MRSCGSSDASWFFREYMMGIKVVVNNVYNNNVPLGGAQDKKKSELISASSLNK